MVARFHHALGGRTLRRALFILVPLAVLPLLLAAALQFRSAQVTSQQSVSARAGTESRAFAAAIGARLGAAEAGAWTFARNYAIFDRAFWREQVAAAAPFVRATVSADSNRDDPERPLVPMAGRQFDDMALVSFGTGERQAALYLVRKLRDPRDLWAYFEIDNDWLWHDLQSAMGKVAVIDANGQWLHGSADAPASLRNVLSTAVLANARDPGIDDPEAPRGELAWQADGREWRGAFAPVPQVERLNAATRWYVVVLTEVGVSWADRLDSVTEYWLPLLFALVAAIWLGVWLRDRYVLPLIELQSAVLRIGQTDYPAQELVTPAELEPLARDVRLAGTSVADQIKALQSLEEVDRLLLTNSGLEPAVDAILCRVGRVMRSRGVGLVLLDADSPQHARVMVSVDNGASLPVARVTMDPDMLADLAGVREGLTVARCEEQRHSFLQPLQELGNQFFWVWPVRTGERLTALLVVGFQEPPIPDPRSAQRGTEFAARLSIALSNSVRDETLYKQAHYDPLTGLPNRVLFNERLAAEIESAVVAQHSGALLYVDLDHFKKVNDSVGHAAGDQLLGIVAQRLRAAVKEGDTVSRLAGDEFTVILPTVDEPESAALVAERIIESLHKPVNLGGRDHFVDASIGIAMFPNDGSQVEELLRNADGAMYRAKSMGRGRAVFFDRQLTMARLDPTQSGLFRALRRREFTLFYQPQYRLSDGALVGVEALLRWQTPRDGTREPKEFIPAAETSGLIVDIGGWVLEAACTQYAAWREQGMAPPRLAINVSAQQLKYAEFPRSVRRVLDKFGIAPQLLEIELTESVLADDAASAALAQLAAQGIRVALDDFGTGYSSLNYLRQHPIHAVKIDRSFLDEVPVNAASATLAETIITMAHALGKDVVAEGVETEEQMQFLREHECDVAQGFYLARPMPAEDIAALLQARRVPLDSAMRAAG